MAQAQTPEGHPVAPPSLIYDSRSDSGEVLWRRLHDRTRPHGLVRLIVHLRNGTTRVGRLVYFDRTIMTLSVEGGLIEIWLGDVAHVIACPG